MGEDLKSCAILANTGIIHILAKLSFTDSGYSIIKIKFILFEGAVQCLIKAQVYEASRDR